jgi:hypothetical protein
VSDVVAVSAPQHGIPPEFRLGEIVVSEGCSDVPPCKPAVWQQERGSNLLATLNSRSDETPGPVSYTTVRSLTDETVRPAGGKRPTAALDGARNILIQNICPGRETTHIGTLVDSVTFAALFDAVAAKSEGRKGAAKPSRLPDDVCDQPYAPGLDEATTAAGIEIGPSLSAAQITAEPKVASEPKVRRVFRDKAKEDLEAKGTGKVKIRRRDGCLVGRTSESKPCKAGFKLRRVDKSVRPGRRKTLKLKATDAGNRRLVKVVEKGRKATAKLRITLSDEAGNAETTKFKVKLKR